MVVSRRFVLKKYPVGLPDPAETFELQQTELPELSEGQARVRTLFFSLDPAMRTWLNNNVEGYRPPVQLGAIMDGGVCGEVIESKSENFQVGDRVLGYWGWQDVANVSTKHLQKIPVGVAPEIMMGAAGLTGLTAYFGLLHVGKPQPGQTVLVSGAAGATGSVVGQIAKLKGCTVVGIAGSDEKCAWLKSIGFDEAINYKNKSYEELNDAIVKATPKGVDVYFDNVGGDILEISLNRMNLNGRIAVCGSISDYNSSRTKGPNNVFQLVIKRLTMQGFLVMDFQNQFHQAVQELLGWIHEGKIKNAETIVNGFENLPSTLLMLFSGSNTGKLLVRASL